MRSRFVPRAIAISLTAGLACWPCWASELSPHAVFDHLRDAALDVTNASLVADVTIEAGGARLTFQEGTLIPASPVAGRAMEVVFVGKGAFELTAPDAIEAGQLELFTGGTSLAEEITAAVVVVTNRQVADALAGHPPAKEVEAKTTSTARDFFSSWRDSVVRRALEVDRMVLGASLGDPCCGESFAALLQGAELGEFVYAVEPDADEQITLGQFVRSSLEEDDARKVARSLAREQRRGRLVGMRTEDLGQWNTWVSASLRDPSGMPMPGLSAWEPTRYTLDVTLDRTCERGSVAATIDLIARAPGRRLLSFTLDSDLAVQRVTDSSGADLFFRRNGDNLFVLLTAPPASGGTFTITVHYDGIMLDKGAGKTYTLRSTHLWYPRIELLDGATYDVTLRWPGKLELVSSGRHVDSGEERDGSRWERRVLELPTIGFAFHLGTFRVEKTQVGRVSVTVAFDPEGAKLGKEVRAEVVAAVRDSLAYFEETFGPYPLDDLTVVTVPRAYSQSFLGFVTLANAQLADYSVFAALLGIEDRRTVIAHEIAHQWWGNLLRWRSYRDQWISEAMASYSAVLFGRHKLDWKDRFQVGPTNGWQTLLTATTDEGRPLESLGPVVLGIRLISDRSSDAYQAIVYKKGALIVDMLARNFSEERFLEMLAQLIAESPGKEVSTRDMLNSLATISGEDLSRFAEQYVFGTGLPELTYSYSFSASGNGRWKVSGRARQQTPYRYSYRAVPASDGFDVVRQAVAQVDNEKWFLVAPVQVAIFDPFRVTDKDGKRKSRKQLDEDQRSGNATQLGRLLLRGESEEFGFEIPFEPKELWFDRDQEVFCRFYNEQRHPKRVLLIRGIDLAAAGRLTEAEAALHAALAADVAGGLRREDADKEALESERRTLDALTHLHLARLETDGGRLADARASLARALDTAGRANRWRVESEARLIESRLDILQGRGEVAFNRLRRELKKTGFGDGGEGHVLLAIAARATGNQRELDKALAGAKKHGADVSSLTQRGS